jgi:hypothetical protein
MKRKGIKKNGIHKSVFWECLKPLICFLISLNKERTKIYLHRQENT